MPNTFAERVRIIAADANFVEAYISIYGKPKGMQISEEGWPLTLHFHATFYNQAFAVIANFTEIDFEPTKRERELINLIEQFEQKIAELAADDRTELDPVKLSVQDHERQVIAVRFNRLFNRGLAPSPTGKPLHWSEIDNALFEVLKPLVDDEYNRLAKRRKIAKEKEIPETDRPSQEQVTRNLKRALRYTVLNVYPPNKPPLKKCKRVHECLEDGMLSGTRTDLGRLKKT